MNLNSKKAFILNMITTLIWLAAGIASVILHGKYIEICFIACILFGYLAVDSYKKWKTEDNNTEKKP